MLLVWPSTPYLEKVSEDDVTETAGFRALSRNLDNPGAAVLLSDSFTAQLECSIQLHYLSCIHTAHTSH